MTSQSPFEGVLVATGCISGGTLLKMLAPIVSIDFAPKFVRLGAGRRWSRLRSVLVCRFRLCKIHTGVSQAVQNVENICGDLKQSDCSCWQVIFHTMSIHFDSVYNYL